MPSLRSSYSDSLRFFGDSDPARLVAEFASPLYVYNEEILRLRCRELSTLLDLPAFRVCFSTKANANPHLLRIIREEGLTADAMSPGELALLRHAGFAKNEICYVCNNVGPDELSLAASGAAHVSIDSLSQLESFGRLHPGGSVMVRVNPGIGAGHHDKVVTAGKNTKFGVTPQDFPRLRETLARNGLRLVGLNQHVGSLFMDPAPYLDAAKWLLETAERFPGVEILDFGGGFGIPYHKYEGEPRFNFADFRARFSALLRDWSARTAFSGAFVIEPGRSVIAECAILLGTAHAVKNNGATRYVGTDLGFSVLARPMLYDAFHDIEVYGRNEPGQERPPARLTLQTIVGNICESGDVLAKDRLLPEIKEGDVIGVLDAGAYGHSMSSNYNQRPRPAEVLIRRDGSASLIRRRDSIDDLLAAYVC